MSPRETTTTAATRSAEHAAPLKPVSAAQRLDRWFGTLPMYRVITLALGLITVAAFGQSLLGHVAFGLGELLGSALTIVLATVASSWLIGRLFGLRAHLESAIITGLILFLILWPARDLTDYVTLAATGALASISKFLFVWAGRHVFNPAAIAAVVMGVTGLSVPAWWVGSEALLPFILMGGAAVLYRTRTVLPVAVYGLIAGVLLLITAMQDDTDGLGASAWTVVANSPVLFLAFFMLTEPLTLPPRRWQKVLVAAAVGALHGTTYWVWIFQSTPELALVIGNLIAFVFIRRGALALRLQRREVIARETVQYTFTPVNRGGRARFAAGQYLELTVPHHRGDSRGQRRFLSIASSPRARGEDGRQEIAVATKVPERSSSYKRALESVPVGSVVQATGIHGDFLCPRSDDTPILFIAGGIGITPIAGQIDDLLHQGRTELLRRSTVVYAVRSLAELAYLDVLERAGVQVVIFSEASGEQSTADALPTDWSVNAGFLDPAVIANRVENLGAHRVHVAGPKAMVQATRRGLRAHGVRRVHTDPFTG